MVSAAKGPQAVTAVEAPALSGARARILDLLLTDGTMTTQEVADRSGQAKSTVQEHLQGLVASNLVARTKRPGPGRGRPTWVYTANHMVAGVDHDSALGMIATLAEGLAGTDAGREAAREAGRTWGRRLRSELGESSDTQALTASMESVGFAPEQIGSGRWRLTRCPLLQAAHEHPEIICGAHAGVLQGLLDEGVDLEPQDVRLLPFAEPGACVVEIPLLGDERG